MLGEAIRVQGEGMGAAILIVRSEFLSRLRRVTTPYSSPSLLGANDVIISPIANCTVLVSIDGIIQYFYFCSTP